MKAEELTRDLSRHGILNTEALAHNLSYDELFIHETEYGDPDTTLLTQLGAVAVDSGIRSEKMPFYLVRQESSAQQIWWAHAGSNQHPIEAEQWAELKAEALGKLRGKALYVMDVYCGSHPKARLALRFVSEFAWRAHFVKNMFIRPSMEDAASFKPDWTIFDVCQAEIPASLDRDAPCCSVSNLEEKLSLIFGIRDDALIKDSLFALMSYRLPERGIGVLASSANQSIDSGESALFLGGEGSGKSTLANDPKRLLIGDDEHGWDHEGIFSLEGGCYGSYRELDTDLKRVVRKNALLESAGNGGRQGAHGTSDLWVSYPLHHREQIVRPSSQGKHPAHLLLLVHDSIGVFPPLANLSHEQALFYFLSGYTAKDAPRGRPGQFSPCFRASALMLPPLRYAEILARKLREHGTRVYLLNTGFRGPGADDKISVELSRKLLQAVFSGAADSADCRETTCFGLQVPRTLPGIDPVLLQNHWRDNRAQDTAEHIVASLFADNFLRFAGYPLGEKLLAHGPRHPLQV